MKKIYSLLVAVLVLTTQAGFSQNFAILLGEDFDAATAPTGWTQTMDQTFPTGISSTTPSDGWAFGQGPYTSLYWDVPASLDASPFAISNDDAVDQNKLEDVLISPIMDFTPFDSAIVLYDVFYDSLYQWSVGYLTISYDAGANWLYLPLEATTLNDGWVEDGWIIPSSIVVNQTTYTFTDQMMIGFLHSDRGGWATGVAIDNAIVAGFNTPCDDIITISGCDVPQTVDFSGFGVLDWEFTTGCGFTTYGQEQLYSFTPTTTGVHTIEVTASSETNFFDYMYKPVSAGCDTIGWSCVSDVLLAGEYGGMNLTAGVEYYILVDAEFDDAQTQTFSIQCPCTYTSQNGTAEGETCGNTDNDGCGLLPGTPTYGSISCGETVSGTTFANGGTRDLDYFELTVASDMDLEFDFGGGLPLNALLIDNCTDFNILAEATAGACNTETLSYSAVAGTYYLLIVPTGFEGYACGAPEAIYDVAMSCTCPESFDAGTITADAAPCYDGSPVIISATPSGQVLPNGYSQDYGLVENGVVTQVSTGPSFTVSAPGTYTIHTLVYDPNELVPALAIGQNAVDVNALLVQGGGSICAGLDLVGATITVNPCGPANDDCSGAVSLTVQSSCSPTSGDVAGATESTTGCAGTADDDVWYSFVATGATATVSVTGSSSFDAVLEVFDGSCGSLTSLECEDATLSGATESVALTGLTQGNTYYVRVYDWYNGAPTTTTFDICVYETPAPPANDDCQGAQSLTVGTSCVTTSGTVESATQSMAGCAGTANDDVWFSFMADGTTATVDVTGAADFDAVLEVFEGSCGSLTSLDCVDNTFDGETETANLTGLTPGNTYYVRVYHWYTAISSTPTFDICVYNIVTGINEALDNGLSVYPNPSNGEFVVEISGVEAVAQLTIIDMTGRTVYTEGVTLNGDFRKNLNLDVANGSYLLQVVTEESVVTRKIQIH
ncbi:MAG: T9SS type A sorting domain-containing protein [Flavobacteriales bacterium]|nr:T9SS type A sorting domain-containing protein [Flavobacteriales bacterium]